MRAVIDIEEDKAGRTQLVVTELPHMCNPDNLAMKIAQRVYLLETGRIVASGDAETIAADDSIRKAYLGF